MKGESKMADANLDWMNKFFAGKGEQKQEVLEIEADMLLPWHTAGSHPFDVEEDDDMKELMAKIEKDGILNPILVRREKDFEGRFEIVSGHRRVFCAKKLGIFAVPAICVDYDDEKATIAMVEANVGGREHIKPSNLAKAYKMYMEANKKRQGERTDLIKEETTSDARCPKPEDEELTLDNRCPRLSTSQSAGLNFKKGASTIKLYVRLANLIPELMQMLDVGNLTVTAGAELSYLSEDKQKAVYKKMQSGYSVNKDEANTLRKLSDEDFLEKMAGKKESENNNAVPKILQPKKPKINESFVTKYLPSQMKKKPVELKQEYIKKALAMYSKYLWEHPEENAVWEDAK